MQYDPIKRSLGKVFNASPGLRIFFYRLLNLLLLRSWHIRHELKKWADRRGPVAEILDAGSGFGQYSWTLSGLGDDYRILGVDVKDEQIKDCNDFFRKTGKSNRISFRVEDLTSFVKPVTFDLILSVDVMEHIKEDRQVFGNFYQSMVPGGMLLISTPSDKGGSDAHDHEEDEVTGFIDEHVRDGYSPEDITEKLQQAGFEKIECRYTYGKPGHLSWKLSMKTPIRLLNKSKLFFILIPFYYLITWPVACILNYSDLKGSHDEGTGLLVKAFKPNPDQ